VLASRYEQDRYLAHLSADELFQRTADVMANALLLNEANRAAGGDPADKTTIRWFQLLSDVTTELHLRSIPELVWYPEVLKRRQHFINPRRKASRAAIRLVSSSKGRFTPPFIVKYGEQKYMRSMIESGSALVRPASYYSKHPTPAIGDNEIEIILQPPPNRIPTDAPELDVPPAAQTHRSGRIKRTAATDYYVYCLSHELEPRLFGDFGYDSCLVIKDTLAFLNRFGKAADQRLGFKMGQTATSARYIDPVLTPYRQLPGPFAKHFRFAYQREFRIVIEPSKKTLELSDLKIHMGPLGDIAELLVINDIETPEPSKDPLDFMDMESLLRLKTFFDMPVE
jgi:hypothetical protein